MFPLRTLRAAVALTLLALSVESWSDGVLPRAELTQLYNSGVYLAERMKTRLGSSSSASGLFSHTGVRVTLADGTKWLVHKGPNFSSAYDTMVERAEDLSSDWRVMKTGKNFQGRKTVGDFVAAGGTDYNLLFDNCHIASKRMMNQ